MNRVVTVIRDVRLAKVLFVILGAVCLLPQISPATGLLVGLMFAQLIGNPYESRSGKWSGLLLKISVVGLGFGMHIYSAWEGGSTGISLTFLCSPHCD